MNATSVLNCEISIGLAVGKLICEMPQIIVIEKSLHSSYLKRFSLRLIKCPVKKTQCDEKLHSYKKIRSQLNFYFNIFVSKTEISNFFRVIETVMDDSFYINIDCK